MHNIEYCINRLNNLFLTLIITDMNRLRPFKYVISTLGEFEDTKGAIRIRRSKKNRQHNGQKKKYKKTNNDQQNIHIKLKIE